MAPSRVFASSVFGVNAKPLQVTFEPPAPAPATTVRIEGLIALPGTGQDFLPPACGYLYYKCKAGDEEPCREQWQELAAAAIAGQCVVFTSRRDAMGALADVGRLRPSSEAPANPDTYAVGAGLGVMTMACGAQFSTACGVGGAGGKGGGGGKGSAGAGGVGPAAGGRGGTASGGVGGVAGGASGQAGATGGGGAVASTGGATASGGSGGGGGSPTTGASGGKMGGSGGADAGLDAAADASPKNPKDGGCSVAGADATFGGLFAAMVLAVALCQRRRRRGGA